MYSKHFKDTVKTETAFSDSAWVYNTEQSIWKLLPATKWRLDILNWVRPKLLILETRLNRYFVRYQFCEKSDKHGCAMRAAWSRAVKAVQKLIRDLTVPYMDRVRDAAHSYLIDEEFCSDFDENRSLISFANGVIDLSIASDMLSPHAYFRPRTAADKLTYALPYNYDPDPDMSHFNLYMSRIMPDAEARFRFQVILGYCFTGLTTEKFFLQMVAHSDAGKTNLIKLIVHAMCSYASMDEVPVEELKSDSNFEHSLATTLAKHPHPRFVAFDETARELSINERLINTLSAGGAGHTHVSLRKKGTGAHNVKLHAKFVISSNHAVRVSASAVGITTRRQGPPFQSTFVKRTAQLNDPALLPPNTFFQDPELMSRLFLPESRAAIAQWMLCGAVWYMKNRLFPPSLQWDIMKSTLAILSDDYTKWLSETYFPTGNLADKVALTVLVSQFKESNRHIRGDVSDGLKCALQSMSTYIVRTTWGEPAPFYGQLPANHPFVEIVGYAGLRKRNVGDPRWQNAIHPAETAVKDLLDAVEGE